MPASGLGICPEPGRPQDAAVGAPVLDLLARAYATAGLMLPLVVTKADVAQMLRIGARTLERRISTGEFPQPDHVESRRSVGWKITTVTAWFERRVAGGPTVAQRRPPTRAGSSR